MTSDHIAVRSEGHQVTFDELNTDVFVRARSRSGADCAQHR